MGSVKIIERRNGQRDRETTISGDGVTNDDAGAVTIAGTVTSVGLSTNVSGLTVGSSPITTSGTITINGTVSAVTEGAVTTHQAALSITESQISDFGTYNNYSHPNHTGDVTSTGDGVTAIAAGVIVNADINAAAAIALSKLATDPLARANHTGTQTLSTISDAGTAAALDVGVTDGDVVQMTTGDKLPAVDGSNLTNLPGGGDVTSASNITDNAVVLGDGGAKGVQESGLIVTAESLPDGATVGYPSGSSITILDVAITLNSPDATDYWEAQDGTICGYTDSTLRFSITDTAIAATLDITVPDEAYGAGWNGSLEVPTKNAVYDKIETLGGGGDALTSNPLSQLAATTSAQLAGVISDETGSGAAVFATSPTLVTPILGTPTSGNASNLTALNATQLTSGTIPAARVGADHIDALTEIAAALKAGTGAKLVTDGKDASAPIYTEKHAASHTISADECYGGVHYVTSAATITLPAVADGMHVTIVTIGAIAVSVDPNASDLIYLDGTALDDGDKITNTSTAGDVAVLTYYDATGWSAATNGWTDGGA